jgi:hypothetical protein
VENSTNAVVLVCASRTTSRAIAAAGVVVHIASSSSVAFACIACSIAAAGATSCIIVVRIALGTTLVLQVIGGEKSLIMFGSVLHEELL